MVLQCDEPIVCLGQRGHTLLRVGRRLLHGRFNTKALQQCRELGSRGQLRANLLFDICTVVKALSHELFDAKGVGQLKQGATLFFFDIFQGLIHHGVIEQELGLDQHACGHVDL